MVFFFFFMTSKFTLKYVLIIFNDVYTFVVYNKCEYLVTINLLFSVYYILVIDIITGLMK